jgi:hypothetical protein
MFSSHVSRPALLMPYNVVKESPPSGLHFNFVSHRANRSLVQQTNSQQGAVTVHGGGGELKVPDRVKAHLSL